MFYYYCRSFDTQNGLIGAYCEHNQCLGLCTIFQSENGETIGRFNRWLSVQYPLVMFKGLDVACLWFKLLAWSESGIVPLDKRACWCVGAWHKNAHCVRFVTWGDLGWAFVSLRVYVVAFVKPSCLCGLLFVVTCSPMCESFLTRLVFAVAKF